jgi:hypothetical protein
VKRRVKEERCIVMREWKLGGDVRKEKGSPIERKSDR